MEDNIFKDLTILYVEDEPLVQKSISSILKRRVKEIFVANNGKEGIEVFKNHINEIDLILTDIEMPIMNGLEMIEEIKKLKEQKPIIIITAFDDEAHKSTLADEFIVKPVKKELLFRAMTESIVKYKKDKE